jgi:hypothetical protein
MNSILIRKHLHFNQACTGIVSMLQLNYRPPSSVEHWTSSAEGSIPKEQID